MFAFLTVILVLDSILLATVVLLQAGSAAVVEVGPRRAGGEPRDIGDGHRGTAGMPRAPRPLARQGNCATVNWLCTRLQLFLARAF